MSSLFELVGDYQRLYEMADEPEMEENAEAWFDTMEGIEGEIEDKAVNYYRVIKNIEADVEVVKAKAQAFKNEYDRLMTIASSKENSVKRIKKNLTDAMIKTGKTKFKNDDISFWTQSTKAVEISPTVDVNKDVPTDYLRFKNPEINKKKVLEDLKGGKELNFAKLVENTEVRFR